MSKPLLLANADRCFPWCQSLCANNEIGNQAHAKNAFQTAHLPLVITFSNDKSKKSTAVPQPAHSKAILLLSYHTDQANLLKERGHALLPNYCLLPSYVATNENHEGLLPIPALVELMKKVKQHQNVQYGQQKKKRP
ncbi:Uncharacterised protein [Candidatus Bartonella washoeensis]|nr:Uncharacterised protein [Bartonella washoeensis]